MFKGVSRRDGVVGRRGREAGGGRLSQFYCCSIFTIYVVRTRVLERASVKLPVLDRCES